MIEVGQIYASTHSGDVENGRRQRRRVTRIDGPFVWLRTDYGTHEGPESRVRLRSERARTIPGHRLVEPVVSTTRTEDH